MRHPPRDALNGLRRTLCSASIVFASLAVLQGCGPKGIDPGSVTIPKDTFVTAYVELREAALNLEPERVDSARAAILAAHGLTKEDMLTFADVHGRDVIFMKDVWDEVEKRLDAMTRDSMRVH